jgi:hypothetical protein
LTVGQAISLSLTMKVAPATETITVTDTPTIDFVKTESSTTLNQVVVTNTPVLGRKFEDLLTLTPGVSIVQGPDGDSITFNGQRGIFNNISLDGGDYNNGFFGEQVGGQRVPIDLPLDAVKEFQVVATGANAEFGRTAAGVVNVITKSGTNELHGSIFHYQRHENLSSKTSDGRPLTDFHREQFGGTIGGPIVKDKSFFFGSVERITGNLQRPNLSEQLGPTPCPVQTPTITANEALIASNDDCARLALINFMRTTRNQEEGLPVRRPLWTTATLAKLDFNLPANNIFTFSYNFNWSKKINETFDVATYGNSANGIEGAPTKIHVLRFSLISGISQRMSNEAHFTYLREDRPRLAIPSNVPADTAMGGFISGPTFRFGAPFFLHPSIDELFWRTQIRDNFSIIWGKHTIKFGGEWIHSLNDQVFRGFFQGRYIFSTVVGFLRYASPPAPGGFGPGATFCADNTWVTAPTTCTAGTGFPQPLLLYLQGAGPNFTPATDAAGASKISNEEFALFIQDQWQVTQNLTFNYGLRWEAQLFPDPLVPPQQTAYGIFLNNPAFPSDGTLPDQKRMFQPRLGFAYRIAGSDKSVLRASWGIFNARQNMLTQVGSITTNGVFQSTIAGGAFANPTILPTWPGLVTATATPCTSGTITNPFPCFTGVRAFDRNYANPRVYTTSVSFEQEIAPDWALYLNFIHSKSVHLTRFLDYSRLGTFAPFLGETMITNSRGKSLYRGFTVGMRKRFSQHFQLDWNYVLSKDLDDDSNERDPFTDRSFDITNLQLDYALSDRDIRHKFNFYSYFELPWAIELTVRMQARSAQPCTPGQTPNPPCNGTRTATNRNSLRKDNEFFSFDWTFQRPIKFGERYAIVPIVRMFNTFNNKNNINPLSAPGLFNFDGFLRQGVGDPRQAEFAVKFTF